MEQIGLTDFFLPRVVVKGQGSAMSQALGLVEMWHKPRLYTGGSRSFGSLLQINCSIILLTGQKGHGRVP